MAGQAVLLLHGAAEDLLHAAADHRQRRHRHAHHVVLHLQVRHRPACAVDKLLVLLCTDA
jgi:hypothetical protein